MPFVEPFADSMKIMHNKTQQFLQDCLELPSDASIDEIVTKFEERIPFQNIMFLAEKPENRRLPTMQQNLDCVFKGLGGVCYTMNCFMKYCIPLNICSLNTVTINKKFRRYIIC